MNTRPLSLDEGFELTTPPTGLLDNLELEKRSVVANNRMNRLRVATGTNGYSEDIRIDVAEFLEDRLEHGSVRWLDLCCGRGKAILEVAGHLAPLGLGQRSFLLGVDLVNMFDPVPSEYDFVNLTAHSLHDWNSSLRFDLITCVHGLHYIGDKLDLIRRAVGLLKQDGLFVANIDLANLKTGEADFDFETEFEGSGFEFWSRNMIAYRGTGESFEWTFNLDYLGADPSAGPNYTGQEAVDSWYRMDLEHGA